jgi:hypothetical protein
MSLKSRDAGWGGLVRLTKYRVGSGAILISKIIFIKNKTRFIKLLLTRDFRQNYGARFIALHNTNLGAQWSMSTIAPLKSECLCKVCFHGFSTIANTLPLGQPD